MTDFNMWEIAILLTLGIIIFGPEKLPELARKAARVIAYLRRIGNDARGQLRAELGPEFDNLQLADLNPKAFLARHLLSGEEVEDLRQIRDDALSSGQLIRDEIKGEGAASGGEASTTDAAEPVAAVPYDPEAT